MREYVHIGGSLALAFVLFVAAALLVNTTTTPSPHTTRLGAAATLAYDTYEIGVYDANGNSVYESLNGPDTHYSDEPIIDPYGNIYDEPTLTDYIDYYDSPYDYYINQGTSYWSVPVQTAHPYYYTVQTSQPVRYNQSVTPSVSFSGVPIGRSVAQPTCSISASARSVRQGGEVTLRWNAQNTTYASLSGVGSVPTSGSRVVQNLGSDQTFELTVSGAGGVGSCLTSVQVMSTPERPPVITEPTPWTPPAPPYARYQAPTCYMSISPSVAYRGDVVNIMWGSTDATYATLTDFGPVGTAGYYQSVATQSRSYVLSIQGPGGGGVCGASLMVLDAPVRPTPQPTPEPQPTPQVKTPTCNIYAAQNTIFTGATTTIRWSTTNATSASIAGMGDVGLSGTKVVSPSQDTKYTLTAKDSSGKTRSCSVSISVRSATSCVITCGGVTYQCAPASTPVSASCQSSEQTEATDDSFWARLKNLFGF